MLLLKVALLLHRLDMSRLCLTETVNDGLDLPLDIPQNTCYSLCLPPSLDRRGSSQEQTKKNYLQN